VKSASSPSDRCNTQRKIILNHAKTCGSWPYPTSSGPIYTKYIALVVRSMRAGDDVAIIIAPSKIPSRITQVNQKTSPIVIFVLRQRRRRRLRRRPSADSGPCVARSARVALPLAPSRCRNSDRHIPDPTRPNANRILLTSESPLSSFLPMICRIMCHESLFRAFGTAYRVTNQVVTCFRRELIVG
jgi:hypothetical protein